MHSGLARPKPPPRTRPRCAAVRMECRGLDGCRAESARWSGLACRAARAGGSGKIRGLILRRAAASWCRPHPLSASLPTFIGWSQQNWLPSILLDCRRARQNVLELSSSWCVVADPALNRGGEAAAWRQVADPGPVRLKIPHKNSLFPARAAVALRSFWGHTSHYDVQSSLAST
jgi:hypothetical protein